MTRASMDGLDAFVAVAQFRSFTGAAGRLQVSPSAVSQSVRALEQRLGVTLLNRSTRSVSLTQVGARFLERISGPLSELRSASEEVGGHGDEPAGLLRLSVTRMAYITVIQPVLARFLDLHPKIDVELAIDNALVDIVARGFDAGIRFGDLVEKDMTAMVVGPALSAHVIASPAYLARRGAPRRPRDLLDHDCIAFAVVTSGQLEQWRFIEEGEQVRLAVRARVTVNDSSAMVHAALEGLGVAYMSNGYIEPLLGDGRLVRLLEPWSPPLPSLTLFHPGRRRAPRKLQAFIDFLNADAAGPDAPSTPSAIP